MTGISVADAWDEGDPYDRYVGRWSRRVAPEFVRWLDIPPGRRWLDVGCGTGALSASLLEAAVPATVTAVDPSAGFLARASSNLGSRARTALGTAADLPLEDASVDVTVSGLVLNFTPDPVAALVEQSRVTVPGGTVAAYVWDYADGMELLRLFWDCAVALDPEAAALDEGARFPLCRPDPLVAAFADAGLGHVEVTALDVDTVFSDFDDLWGPFLGGQGPAPSYVASIGDEARLALRELLRRRAHPGPDGAILLTARAWAVRGTRAGLTAGPVGPR